MPYVSGLTDGKQNVLSGMMEEVEDIKKTDGNVSKDSRHYQIKAKSQNEGTKNTLRVQQTQQSHRKYQGS